jgi:hypothetical protein
MANYDRLFAAWGERETISQAAVLDLAIATVLRLNGLTTVTLTAYDMAETMRQYNIERAAGLEDVPNDDTPGIIRTELTGWTVSLKPKESTGG